MHKSPLKRKYLAQKRILRKVKNTAKDYISDMPVKTVGVSLVTGLLTGLAIGYFSNNNHR